MEYEDHLKALKEFEDSFCEPLMTKIRLNYKSHKMFKKLWGKQRAWEISFGRKMMNLIKKNYEPALLQSEWISKEEALKIWPNNVESDL